MQVFEIRVIFYDGNPLIAKFKKCIFTLKGLPSLCV